ncbi:MAG: EamA family transporter [Gemmatimonadales bacterium]|nr:EamA family transporter [Gemmatimonadales bacterium]
MTRTDVAATPGRVLAAFVTLYLVWGSTYLGIRIAVETLPPFLLAGARFVVAGAVILAIARHRGTAFPKSREWLGAAGVGLCLVTLSNALIVWVEQRVPSGVVALFAAGSPLLISLLTWQRTGTPLGTRRLIGLALGTVGLVLLGSETFAAIPDPLRLGMIALAMIAWAIGATYGRDWPQTRNLLMGSGAQMFAGGWIAIVAGVLLGEANHFDANAVSWQSLAAWGYLTVFGSMLAYTVFQWLMEHVDATAVSSYTYVNPIVALALGALVADEHITPRIVLATMLLVPAVVLVVVKPRTANGELGTETPQEP